MADRAGATSRLAVPRIAPVPPGIQAYGATLLAADPAPLLSAEGIGSLAKSLGLGWFDRDHILALWGAAILRADLVTSATSIEADGLHLVQTTEGRSVFSDCRRIIHRKEGYGSTPHAAAVGTSGETEVLFHPYRVFVLYHVQRTLIVSTSATQYLMFREGVTKIAERGLESLDRWTSSEAFGQRFDEWNTIAEMAALLESTEQRRHAYSDGAIDDGQQQVDEWLRGLGAFGLREPRGELGRAASIVDENPAVHVLVRLMNSSQRQRLKGDLGACMLFLRAAEAIRRPAERVLGAHLPEEDEIGFGVWVKGARRRLYGTDRVFDGNGRNLRDYLTILGIDFGTKLRCYVEGHTEAGALEYGLSGAIGIEVIDLKGNLLQRGGKIVEFIDSLRRDYRSHIFSLVLLDGDRQDAIRALNKAVSDGDCFAMHFIAQPDFELASFTPLEMLGIALDVECRADVDDERKSVLHATLASRVSSVASAEDFFSLLRQESGIAVSKGEEWGKALMAYAQQNPNLPAGHRLAGEKRSILRAVELAERALRSVFVTSVQEYVIDAATGQPKRRASPG